MSAASHYDYSIPVFSFWKDIKRLKVSLEMIGRNRYRLILVLNVLLPSALDLKAHYLSNDTDWLGMSGNKMHWIHLNHVMGSREKVANSWDDCMMVRLYSSSESSNSYALKVLETSPLVPRFALKRNSKLTFDVLIHKADWKPRHLCLTHNPRNA